MQRLKDILYKAPLVDVAGSTDLQIAKICFDSRKVVADTLFVAVKGLQTDGHEYIAEAIKKGAVAIVCEEFPKNREEHIAYLKVKDSAYTLGIIADNFFHNPSAQLSLVGITGTNGKTTVATLLYTLFQELGHKSGLLSTVENRIGNEIINATHTTPDSISLNAMMAQMVASGCTYCFMEVSSHAIDQNRIAGLKFDGGVYTNISHDHLDYHRSFQEYINTKKRFFDHLPKQAFALSNIDDKKGRTMLQNTPAKVHTYGLRAMGDFKGKIKENNFIGLVMDIDGEELHSQLIGEFNAYNLMSVYATARLLKMDKLETLKSLSKMKAAEGRFDYVFSRKEKIIGIVDYAHTPDALKNVLSTINKIKAGNEKVISVFGCGGDRDKKKRPLMAEIACKLSDNVILTSDNPRSEEPSKIIRDMEKDLSPNHRKKVLALIDRKEAIKVACTIAESGDIILVAGKGHEKYQETKGQKEPFDDKKVLAETFRELGK